MGSLDVMRKIFPYGDLCMEITQRIMGPTTSLRRLGQPSIDMYIRRRIYPTVGFHLSRVFLSAAMICSRHHVTTNAGIGSLAPEVV